MRIICTKIEADGGQNIVSLLREAASLCLERRESVVAIHNEKRYVFTETAILAAVREGDE